MVALFQDVYNAAARIFNVIIFGGMITEASLAWLSVLEMISRLVIRLIKALLLAADKTLFPIITLAMSNRILSNSTDQR